MASGLENMVTDEVIKRRLLIDGDGAGDDRKLIALTKSFANWCMAMESALDCKVSFRRLVSQVHQADYAAKRTHKSINVNEAAQNAYAILKTQVEEEIELTKKEITASKSLLDEATKLRKHSMEYDSLAKLIHEKPDRKDTDAKKQELEEELKILWDHRRCLVNRMNIRSRNISVMLGGLKKLREILKEEDLILENQEKAANETQPEQIVSVPMDVDDPPVQTDAVENNCSPVEQMFLEPVTGLVPDNKNISGTITSVPVSPLGKANPEKYEDLSESETDD